MLIDLHCLKIQQEQQGAQNTALGHPTGHCSINRSRLVNGNELRSSVQKTLDPVIQFTTNSHFEQGQKQFVMGDGVKSLGDIDIYGVD
jgi:hypothetical protein